VGQCCGNLFRNMGRRLCRIRSLCWNRCGLCIDRRFLGTKRLLLPPRSEHRGVLHHTSIITGTAGAATFPAKADSPELFRSDADVCSSESSTISEHILRLIEDSDIIRFRRAQSLGAPVHSAAATAKGSSCSEQEFRDSRAVAVGLLPHGWPSKCVRSSQALTTIHNHKPLAPRRMRLLDCLDKVGAPYNHAFIFASRSKEVALRREDHRIDRTIVSMNSIHLVPFAEVPHLATIVSSVHVRKQ